MPRNRLPGTLLLALLSVSLLRPASAPAAPRDLNTAGTAIHPPKPDPAISKALASIDSPEIEHTIKTLVAFHTRSTLSSMEPDLPPGRGINAAADWIESEFKR